MIRVIIVVMCIVISGCDIMKDAVLLRGCGYYLHQHWHSEHVHWHEHNDTVEHGIDDTHGWLEKYDKKRCWQSEGGYYHGHHSSKN